MNVTRKSDQPDAKVLAELIADYNAAAKIHVPNWRGGINKNVAVELIRIGWRKDNG
jgi:hypothetical protein